MQSSPSSPRRPKIAEIDIVRAVSILAVVMIHATSRATYLPAAGSMTQKLFFSVNTLGAFAVPVFLFVSGLVLFYSYFDRWKAADTLRFYGKRAISLAYPYLVFSLLYYLFFYVIVAGYPFDIRSFLGLLPWGHASYHLYFMIIIAQFYLLFPLLIALAKASRGFERGMALIGIAVQFAYHYAMGQLIGTWISPENIFVKHGATLFITYFAVFMIGSAIGIHYAAVSAWVRKHWAGLSLLAILIGLTYVGMFWRVKYFQAKIDADWFKLAYNAYAISMGIALIGFSIWLAERAPKLAIPFMRLGKMSFGVYLLHPFVLYGFGYFFKAPGDTVGFSLITAAGFVCTVAVTWALVELYHGVKKRVMPQRKKASEGAGHALSPRQARNARDHALH